MATTEMTFSAIILNSIVGRLKFPLDNQITGITVKLVLPITNHVQEL